MQILQAWVYTLSNSDACESIIYRDLQSIHSAVNNMNNDHKAFIHIGFNSLDRALVAQIMNEYEGKIFATAAAYFSLSDYIYFEAAAITTLKKEPVFCDVKQSLKNEPSNTILEQSSHSVTQKSLSPLLGKDVKNSMFIQESNSWINTYKLAYPKKADVFSEWSIENDESYFILEKKLSYEERIELGKYRQQYLHTSECTNSPQCLLRTCPPWLLDREISTVAFSVRIKNVLNNKNIQNFKELSTLTNFDLLEFSNFGRKSLSDMCGVIMSVLIEGPFGDEGHTQLVLRKSLFAHISETLKKITTREADILSKRMGLGCVPHTLEQIGVVYDVTRERVRQIESKAIKKVIMSEYWDDVLLNKVEQYQQNQNGPPFLHHLVELEPWFSNFFDNQHILKYLIENFCEDKFTVLKYEGLEIISSLPQKKFEENLSLISEIASTAVKKRWALAKFVHEIEAIFPVIEAPLANLVADQWEHKFYTVKNSQGFDEIISDSRGANGAVLKVLEESNTPMHYSEVHKILSKDGYEGNVRRVHNALGDMGYVFGRGKYGLEKHLPLTQDEIDSVINNIIELIYSYDAKQWHTNEIYDFLSESILLGDKISSDIINVVLQTNEVELNYLGRNVWCRSGVGNISTTDRVDVRQAIISILIDNNSPMSAASIIDILKKQRGLPRAIQITPGDPLVRIGRGIWGILDRDIVITPKQRKSILDCLYQYFNNTNKGIALSQMRNIISENEHLKTASLTPDVIYGLCQLDPRFRTAHGELLGLSKWDDVRCYTLRQATRDVLGNNAQGLTLDEIRSAVNELLTYDIEGRLISQILTHIGQFDTASQKWCSVNETSA